MSDLPPFGLGYPRTELRRQLVDAVLCRDKTSTTGIAEDEEPAQPGDRFVLVDFDDQPVGIVEVTEAREIPAGEIDVQFAREEGEGFESVEDWREAHERFFGRPIPDDLLVQALRFRLVERL